MWLRTPNVLPYFPIMNDRIVLRGDRYKYCFDYWSTTEASTSWAESPLGLTYCNSDNNATSFPSNLLSFENATKLCGDKGLWFPDSIQHFKNSIKTTDPLLDGKRGFVKSQHHIWTDAKRFNQSHFIVKNQVPFDATNLVSCRRNMALFRSYVTLRKTKYKYGTVNMMDNGADCVCWTRGLFKEDVPGLILELNVHIRSIAFHTRFTHDWSQLLTRVNEFVFY